MQLLRYILLSTIFIFGLLFNPNSSFEKQVDVALKFESGLLIKKNIEEKTTDLALTPIKKRAKNNFALIKNENRESVSKDNFHYIVNDSFSLERNNSYAISSYFYKIKSLNIYKKDLSQLQVLLI